MRKEQKLPHYAFTYSTESYDGTVTGETEAIAHFMLTEDTKDLVILNIVVEDWVDGQSVWQPATKDEFEILEDYVLSYHHKNMLARIV